MAEDRFTEGYAVGRDTTGGNGGFGFGGEWGGLIGLLIVASLFGNGGFGFGFGNRGGCATQADVRAAVDQQTLISKIDQQTYGLADTFNSLNNTLNSNFRSLDNSICTLGYQQAQGVNTLSHQLSHQISDCCCTTQRAIDSVRYDMSKGFCDVIRAGQDNTRAILDYLTGEKISSLQAENAGLKAQISSDRQSAYLLSELKPCPSAAYIVPNPNCCYNYNVTGFGYGNGCGCN